MTTKLLSLAFIYDGRNIYRPSLDIPTFVRAEATYGGMLYVLYAGYAVDADEPGLCRLVGRYRSIEGATYAANGHFADEINAINGVELTNAQRNMWT